MELQVNYKVMLRAKGRWTQLYPRQGTTSWVECEREAIQYVTDAVNYMGDKLLGTTRKGTYILSNCVVCIKEVDGEKTRRV